MNIQEACLNRYPSPQSRRRIGYELNRLAQLFQIASVNDIDWPTFTRATIGALLARPELINRKAASQNFTLSVIKSLCEEACFQQLMPLEQYFAIERIPNFRGNSHHGSPCLSSDDIRQLLQGCISGGTPKDMRDTAILAVGLGCGLRRSEISGLQISNIDLDRHLIQVLGKGNKLRYIGLNANVIFYLKKWLEVRGSGGCSYCFVKARKGAHLGHTRPLSPEGLCLMVKKRSSVLIGRTISTHDLRRTFASLLLSNGIDINSLRLVMGHSDIRTTQIYDRRDEMMRINSIAQVPLLPALNF